VGYQAGVALVEYVRGSPTNGRDAYGLQAGAYPGWGQPNPPRPPYYPGRQYPWQRWQVRLFLHHALSKGCPSCNHCNPDSLPDCNELDCLNDALLIGDAIGNTLEGNFTIPWWPFSERYNGYYCWAWAEAFYRAATSLNSKCFKVAIEAASDLSSGKMHWYISIKPCSGRTVYVDDSFWNRRFCHFAPPCGGIYEPQGEQACLPSDWPDDFGLVGPYPNPIGPNGNEIP